MICSNALDREFPLPPAPAKPCPYCRRPGSECWTMPCLGLECDLAKGERAVRRWAKATGGTFVRRKKED